jgi:hypothetical protein
MVELLSLGLLREAACKRHARSSTDAGVKPAPPVPSIDLIVVLVDSRPHRAG